MCIKSKDGGSDQFVISKLLNLKLQSYALFRYTVYSPTRQTEK